MGPGRTGSSRLCRSPGRPVDSPPRLDSLQDRGWHPCMRKPRTITFQPQGWGKWQQADQLTKAGLRRTG